MSQLDALLTRSLEKGAYRERRRFTLSRDKAIEKQREFALRHPKQYCLELVQSAVHSGATYIAIDTRPNSLLVAWVGGRPFTEKQLENVFDYLFADRTDLAQRHLVQLAIGLNAILQRKPSVLRIETGSGEDDSVRMDIDHQGRGTVGVPDTPIAGTYLYCEFSTGWFTRFLADRITEEHTLIEERCLYTHVPILLNGKAPFGYRSGRHIEVFGARVQKQFDDEGRRGVVAIHTSRYAPTGFRMVMGGVWITTLPLQELATEPLVGVVCDDFLRKTADQSDIVQDHHYVEMLHEVQPHATSVMKAIHGPTYSPPGLPPIPKATVQPRSPADKVELEPLPSKIPMLGPARGTTTLNALRSVRGEPVFRCHPDDANAIEPVAEPHRFPARVVLLTEGQAATLEAEAPDLSLFRLTTPADVDFIRRVQERNLVERVVRVRKSFGEIRLRLRLEGRSPWFGQGPGQIPVCVVHRERTEWCGPLSPDRPQAEAFFLPDVWVEVEVKSAGHVDVEDAVYDALVDHAWELAAPRAEPVHEALLCAVMGHQVVPRLMDLEGQPMLSASLPVNWDRSLRDLPLASTEAGPLTLSRFIDLMGTDTVIRVRSEADLQRLEPLEQRFGYGHLTQASLTREPMFGVGRLHRRWVWLHSAEQWTSPALTRLLWVPASRVTALEANEFRLTPTVFLTAHYEDDEVDDREGLQLLHAHLARMQAEADWTGQRTGTDSRARALGRLALIELSVHLASLDVPLFSPTNGGRAKSLNALLDQPRSRAVAEGGVVVHEPHTYQFTLDELKALEKTGRKLRLRYDDAPEVWQSLADGTHPGWLLRHEVEIPGLRGWLGLRQPYDSSSGIMVRTTGQLLALPEMDRRIPCHGKLWPTDRTGKVSEEQAKLLQLAGLRLYQELLSLLRSRIGPELRKTAALYGFSFAYRSWRTAGESLPAGTAKELARAIDVFSEEGARWGTLERWLSTDPEHRPDPPASLVLMDYEDDTSEDVEGAAIRPALGSISLSERIQAALGSLWGPVEVVVGSTDLGRGASAAVIDERVCRRDRVVYVLNSAHPAVQRAKESERHREILLLEMARRLGAWGELFGLEVDVLHHQQILLAQHMDR